jgi:hypothetical protein
MPGMLLAYNLLHGLGVLAVVIFFGLVASHLSGSEKK